MQNAGTFKTPDLYRMVKRKPILPVNHTLRQRERLHNLVENQKKSLLDSITEFMKNDLRQKTARSNPFKK